MIIRWTAIAVALIAIGCAPTYEPDRDLLTSVENLWPGAASPQISKYAYASDVLGRRESVVRTGSAFDGLGGASDIHFDAWSYNDRHELIASERFLGSDPQQRSAPDSPFDRAYTYDPIGNRATSTEGTGPQTTYTSNDLNQYDPVTTASAAANSY